MSKAPTTMESYETFLAVTHKNVYSIDTWTKKIKQLVSIKSKSSKSVYRSVASFCNGNYAVGY